MVTYPEVAEDGFIDLLSDPALDRPCERLSAPLNAEVAPEAERLPENTDDALAPIPGMVSEPEMARLLGITANRVRTLARDGMLHRPVKGQYEVRASLKTYLSDLRDKASRMGPGAKSTPANSALNAEKLRLAKQQADKIEIQNAAARGEMVKASEVEREWASVLRDLRASMLAVSSRCGATLPHLSAHDVSEIDREIRSALEGLADGN